MVKVIAIGPGGKAQSPQRDTRYEPIVLLTLKLHGLDRLIISPPCANFDQADDVRRGIYRSCRHYCSCRNPICTRKFSRYCPDGGQRLSTDAIIVRDDQDRLRVQFSLFDKQAARRRHIARYGTDRSTWPYDPKARRP